MSRLEKQISAVRILVLVLLLAAQGMAHAHQIDHAPADESFSCGICSVATQHDDVTMGNSSALSVPASQLPPLLLSVKQIALRQRCNLCARSPPLSC